MSTDSLTRFPPAPDFSDIIPSIQTALEKTFSLTFKEMPERRESDPVVELPVDESLLAALAEKKIVEEEIRPPYRLRSLEERGDMKYPVWEFIGDSPRRFDVRIFWGLSWSDPGVILKLVLYPRARYAGPLIDGPANDLLVRTLVEFADDRAPAIAHKILATTNQKLFVEYEDLGLEKLYSIGQAFRLFAERGRHPKSIVEIERSEFSPFTHNPCKNSNLLVPESDMRLRFGQWTSDLQHFCTGLQPKTW